MRPTLAVLFKVQRFTATITGTMLHSALQTSSQLSSFAQSPPILGGHIDISKLLQTIFNNYYAYDEKPWHKIEVNIAYPIMIIIIAASYSLVSMQCHACIQA